MGKNVYAGRALYRFHPGDIDLNWGGRKDCSFCQGFKGLMPLERFVLGYWIKNFWGADLWLCLKLLLGMENSEEWFCFHIWSSRMVSSGCRVFGGRVWVHRHCCFLHVAGVFFVVSYIWSCRRIVLGGGVFGGSWARHMGLGPHWGGRLLLASGDVKCGGGVQRGGGAAPARLTHGKGLWGSRPSILCLAPLFLGCGEESGARGPRAPGP